MPAPIHVKIDQKGLQRFTDFVFEPGPVEVVADGHEVLHWLDVTVDRVADPGLTVAQVETLKDLIADGVTLALGEDGKLVVVVRPCDRCGVDCDESYANTPKGETLCPTCVGGE